MANMKRIELYRTINGASSVEEFLETLDDNQAFDLAIKDFNDDYAFYIERFKKLLK